MKKKFIRNFKKGFNPHLVCGNDDMRPQLSCIYFENGYLYSTDSHVLLKLSLKQISNFDDEEIKFLDKKLIHKDIFKKILSHNIITIKENGFYTNENQCIILYEFSKIDRKYPNCDAVFPKNITPMENIIFDMSKLLILAKAMPNMQYKFNFYGKGLASILHFKNENYSDCCALIMSKNE